MNEDKIKIEITETKTGQIVTNHYPAGFLHDTIPVTTSVSITDRKKWREYMDPIITRSKRV